MAIKQEIQEKIKPRENFSKEEIYILRSEIENYKVNGLFLVGDEFKLAEDKGLIKVYHWCHDWKEIKGMSQIDYGVVFDKMIEYQEFQKKISIIQSADGKRNYAKQMELKEYEEIAKTM